MPRFALLFCLTIPLFAQQGPVNLDFERSAPGDAPAGWGWVQNAVYSAATAEDCRTPDSSCVVVRRHGEGDRSDFGYVTQSFEATSLRGKQVRFRAWLRLEAPTLSGAELFLRVDRPGGAGDREYTFDQKITTRDWTMREIVGRIDDDAVRVTMGMTFRGLGSAYMADAAFETVGD